MTPTETLAAAAYEWHPRIERDGVTLYAGDCRDVLLALPDLSVDVVVTDPPYSERVHGKSRRGGSLPDAAGGRGAEISRARDLGFESLDAETMDAAARELARLSRRWVLVFCNVEMSQAWAAALERHGLEYLRTGAWIKLGAPPQFTGDRPAMGFEAIVIAHRPGRKRWNGGGGHAVWTFPIELNRGGANPRLHTTQKPLPLMRRLVALFSDPGETVLDPFAGSGTTGIACRDLGRRAILVERDAAYVETIARRLGEPRTLAAGAETAGDLPLFGGAA